MSADKIGRLYDSEVSAVENGLKLSNLTEKNLIGTLNFQDENYYVYVIFEENAIGISKVVKNKEGYFIWESVTAPLIFRANDPSDELVSMNIPISEEVNLLVGQVLIKEYDNVNISPKININPIIIDKNTGFFFTITNKIKGIYDISVN